MEYSIKTIENLATHAAVKVVNESLAGLKEFDKWLTRKEVARSLDMSRDMVKKYHPELNVRRKNRRGDFEYELSSVVKLKNKIKAKKYYKR